MKRIAILVMITCAMASAQTNLGPVVVTQKDSIGKTSAPANPPAGYCREYFNSTTGQTAYLTSSGSSCAPPAAPGSPTGSIQGNCAGALCGIPNTTINGVTGAMTTTATFGLNGGGNFTGTFTGNPTLSGNPIFSSNPNFTGLPTFSCLSQGKVASALSTQACTNVGQDLYCDAYTGGADNGVNIQNCINAQGVVAMGIVNATGLTSGTITINNNFIPASLTPNGITVKLGGGTIITNVPILLQNKVELFGLGAQGAAGLGQTVIQAGPNFPLACVTGTVAGQGPATCLGTISTTIQPGSAGACSAGQLYINAACTSSITSVSISGTSTQWSTGANTQILQPGCRIAVGTFSTEGLLTNGFWGVVKNGTTPTNTGFVLGLATVNGTGSASGTATFAKYCNVVEDGDGVTTPEFAIGLDHIGIDTQAKDGVGCWGDLYSQEKTYLKFVHCRLYNDAIGMDVESTSAINIGPFENVDTFNGAGANANTIDIYDASAGSRAVWRGGTHNHLQPSGCTSPQKYFVILEDSTAEWSQHHQEGCGTGSSIALQIGQDPANILAPVFFVFGDVNCHNCFIHNNNIGSSASGSGIATFVNVGSSGHPQNGATISDNTSNGNVTNALSDHATNGANTITFACNGNFLGHYTTDTNGNPASDAPVACINRASTFDMNSLYQYAPGGFVPQVAAISGLYACTAATEGKHTIATDCNAACTVGGTCTGGGATHCELYCNSTPAYLETGR